MRKSLLVFLLWSLGQPAWSDSLSSQKLNEVGSRSYLLSASALMYFNPQEPSPNQRSLNAVFHHLSMLETYMASLQHPPTLTQPLAEMRSIFTQLEALPLTQRERYPELLQQLLIEHQKLRLAAADAYAEARVSSDSAGLMLNAQSHDLAGLLLDYQLRHYPKIGASEQILPTSELQALAESIDQRFDRLIIEHAEHAEALGKINAQYRFVRTQVLQGKGHLHGGVEFYLTRAVLDLHELAATLVQTSG